MSRQAGVRSNLVSYVAEQHRGLLQMSVALLIHIAPICLAFVMP